MEINNQIFWFSVVVFILVIIWALSMIKAYNKTKNN